MLRLDVSDLRIFRAVAEAGSMTVAAGKVHLAVASVSERIRQMEVDIGVPLLVRNRAGMSLTDAGRVLLHHALKVLRQVDFMNEDVFNFGRTLRGYVRLFATTYSVMELLPGPVAAFMKEYPSANLNIEEHLSEDIVQAVRSGIADLGIIGHFMDPGELEATPIASDRLSVIVDVTSPLCVQASVYFEDLLSYEFVGLGRGSRLQSIFEAHARNAGLPLRHKVQTRNLDSVGQLVAKGVGIGIIPRRTAVRLSASIPIRVVALKNDWATYNVDVCCLKRDELSPPAARLRERLIGMEV